MSIKILYTVTIILLVLSTIKSKKKTKKSLKKASMSLKKNLRMMITIMIIMGVVLTVINPDYISKVFGKESGLVGILIGLGVGSVSFMPSFIAFPLGANLLQFGAGYPQVAGFISSLMGVGVMSIGMESKYFGKRVTLLRNGLALVASIIFVIIVEVAL